MPTITRHLINSDAMQMIETYSDSMMLYVRQQNDLSQPELFIMEEQTSIPVLKSIMVLTAEQSIPITNLNLMNFLGTFSFRNDPSNYLVFEITDEDISNTQ